MVRKFLNLAILLLIASCAFAQVPNSFSYQAVIRDASNELVVDRNISIQISILTESESGSPIYTENHSVTSNEYGLITLKIGEGSPTGVNFSEIIWDDASKFIKVGADITGGSTYQHIGTSELLSVPFALQAQTAATLGGKGVYATNSDTLFVVKDNLGRPVFAVFPDGAKVIVDQTVKGNIGGFAVSGRTTGKATDENIFTVTPDSTRIYVKNSGGKGAIGGFAVSGRTTGKASAQEIFTVNSDSTRVYISETAKGAIGGFAVSGRTTGKATANDYFNVSGSGSASVDKINPSEARMLWYPKSEAFLVGRVLVENADSVGLNSMATGFESKAVGDYSQALGYNSIARGDYSTAIGRDAVAQDTNSFAFGNGAIAYGENSYAFGDDAIAVSDYAYAIGAGSRAVGEKSFAIGSVTKDTSGLGSFTQPPIAFGNYSMAMGLGSKTEGEASTSIGAQNVAYGDFSTALGSNSKSVGNFSTVLGFASVASGDRATALGHYASASGYGSMAIGYRSTTESTAGFSFAAGLGSRTSSYGAVALGVNCVASGSRSVALGDGCDANGIASFAAVKDAVADGHQAVAMGMYVTADGWGSYALGRYASTNLQTGSFVYNSVDGKTGLMPSKPYEMNFKSENGFRFFAAADTAIASAFVIENGGSVGIGTKSPNSKLHINSSSGQVGLRVQIAGSSKLVVNSNGGVSIGTTIGAATNSLYVAGDVSGLSITDRTPYPKDLKTAYEAVQSMKRLPEGEYQEDNKEHQLDHSTLHPFVTSSDGEHRDLSATVSAQNEVIKDLIKQIEELKKQVEELKKK